MNILITNDDGIYSPGIAALAKRAKQFGTVKIVAPDVEQSSMGHAITHSRPLSYRRAPITFDDIEAFRVNGTPADCVALGLYMFPDTQVVLSGINMGPNLGNSMWHSGTLAAAKQATLLGITGIALSTPVGKTEPDFEGLSRWTGDVLKLLLNNKGPALYNVNFPPKPRALSWTRQSVRLYDGSVVPGEDPMGRKNYWITVVPLEPAEKGTDRWAVENGLVSITPLRLDLTAHDELAARLASGDINNGDR
ncbi:MAG: 5'/3'-nucleotidase SurE [Sphingobacterium sp.]|nr:5'/3'-nucleotidase SurE [Sphingobacterium sp.]